MAQIFHLLACQNNMRPPTHAAISLVIRRNNGSILALARPVLIDCRQRKKGRACAKQARPVWIPNERKGLAGLEAGPPARVRKGGNEPLRLHDAAMKGDIARRPISGNMAGNMPAMRQTHDKAP
jgi:hypothetical protein